MTPILPTVLNGLKLHEIATSSPTAQEMTLYYAGRQRQARNSSTDLEDTKKRLLRMGKRIVAVEYNKYWNDLENAGLGSIIQGRNGRPTRFVWSYSLKEIAKASIEGQDLKVMKLSHPTPKKVINVAPKPRKRRLTISGKRRPGRPATVVSLNLSKGEVLTLQRILDRTKK